MDASAVRRWIARFEAAARADRAETERTRVDADRAIALALSLIAAARGVAAPSAVLDRRREAEDDAVRRTWALLRARLAR